ncbi:hypothetical protein K3758_15680 [Sulfitobacter sp. W002]|uniref:hypothetical protein n=1 Tax=Sulfitobacter sp. W002 TaxID=2867024 RepID=UPI0021A8E1D6|nr:hypothetical protein [Sulfitobacter sp. W002]UWR29761.1 hypothetical protein K3758_15680 [Sulfitobacter sp. W002]
MDYFEIKIDLDVYKMIESERISFAETHNDIIRRKYGTQKTEVATSIPDEQVKASRVTGRYPFLFNGIIFGEDSLKSAYKKILLLLDAENPKFLDELSKRETRGRRIVSQDPKRLFIRSPHLTPQHGEKLNDEYWYDTNLSKPQTISRIKIACTCAGVDFGTQLKLRF